MRLFTLIRWLIRGRFGQLRPRFLRHVFLTRYGAHRPPLYVIARDIWRFLGWLRWFDAAAGKW